MLSEDGASVGSSTGSIESLLVAQTMAAFPGMPPSLALTRWVARPLVVLVGLEPMTPQSDSSSVQEPSLHLGL